MTTLAIGQTAPVFKLPDLDHKPHTLNQDSARSTLAVFFKTTCPTCMLAWSYIEKIHQAYRDAGLTVWGVSQHDHEHSTDFVKQHGSTFPILVDAKWQVSKVYDPEFVPTLWLIDPAGKIIDRVVSFDKAGLNRLSKTIAAQVGVPAVIVASNGDGNPSFQPG